MNSIEQANAFSVFTEKPHDNEVGTPHGCCRNREPTRDVQVETHPNLKTTREWTKLMPWACLHRWPTFARIAFPIELATCNDLSQMPNLF